MLGRRKLLKWMIPPCALFLQAQAYAISLLEEIPKGLTIHIASFIPMHDVLTNLELVSKKCHTKWGNQKVWRQYARRIPGFESFEAKAKEHSKVINKKHSKVIDYKSVIQSLMTPYIIILEGLNGGIGSVASAISADGKSVVGYANNGHEDSRHEPVIWREGKEIKSLVALNGGKHGTATSINANGKVVVGSFIDSHDHYNFKAFIWREGKGMEFLGTLNGGNESNAYALSADGKSVAGSARDGHDDNRLKKAFLWREGKEMKSLGTLNGGNESIAHAISADGKSVVGEAADGHDGNRFKAFIWRKGKGMEFLGTLNGGNYSCAYALSADGKIIVGRAQDGHDGNKMKAFIWREGKKMEPLGTLNGGNESIARAISADGKVVVGQSADGHDGNKMKDVIYVPDFGILPLAFLLEKSLPENYKLVHTTSVNVDGTFIAGRGKSNGDDFAWKAYVPRLDIFKEEGFDLSKLKIKAASPILAIQPYSAE